MQSVGHAYAVLLGRRTGNKEEANRYLSSMSDLKRRLKNRQESRTRKQRAKRPYRPGQR